MTKGIGRLLQLGVARETTRGTIPTSPDYYIPFSEVAFDEKYENAVDEASRGVIEDSFGQSRTKNWAEGKITCPIEDLSFGVILYSLMGTYAKTTNSDASNVICNHTFTVAQSAQHQSMSFYIDDPLAGADYKYGTGMIDTFEINYELKKFLEFTINVMTVKGVTATLTPSSTAQNRFLPQHLTFKVASSYSTVSTGTAIPLKSLKLKISKHLESDDVLGNVAPADFLNKQFTIEGTLEALWQNESDFKTAALAGTAKAIRIQLANTDVTIGTAANPTLILDLAKVVFTDITRPLVLTDLVKQTLSFKAHYSTSDSIMAQFLLTNTRTTIY